MAGVLVLVPAGEGLARAPAPQPSAPDARDEAIGRADAEPTNVSVDVPDVVPGEVVVRYRAGTAPAGRRAARALAGAVEAERPGISGVEVLTLGADADLAEAVAALRGRPDVLYVEPNAIVRATDPVVPDDPRYGEQWGLPAIDAPSAWSLTTGSSEIAVGVVDTGVQADHPDLADNVLTGLAMSWVGGDPNVDLHGHGTHVAGIVGAVGNNGTGIAGVAWEVGIVPLQVLGPDGFGRASDVAAAFDHAGQLGLPIVNASLGSTRRTRVVQDAIRAHPSTLYVTSAGNEGWNNDRFPVFPCSHPFPNVLCVTATDRADRRALFGNVGLATVHLGAPGMDILSTWQPNDDPDAPCPGELYCELSGTSMGTPHVAGVAALLGSVHPTIGARRLKEALLRSVDPIPSLANTAVAGRLNAPLAIAAATRLMDDDVDDAGRLLSSDMDLRPRRRYQAGRPLELRWGGDGSTYDVRHRWTELGGRFRFALATVDSSATSRRFRGRFGSTHCFQVRTRDAARLTSPWSVERCTSVPANDRALQRRGVWTRKTGRAGHFRRSFSQSRRRGSTLELAGIRGATEVAVVVTRCPRCGAVQVLFNGEPVRRVGLRAPRVRKMRFVRLPIRGSGTLVLRVAGRGRPVRIEGVGVARA